MRPRLESTFLKAAYSVLKYIGTPLSARAITRIAIQEGYLDENREGRTPWQTMKSKLSVHIRTYGSESIFVRAAPGRFHLRELLGGGAEAYQAPPFRAGPAHERIMVFPQSALDDVGRFQGVSTNWHEYFTRIAAGSSCREIDRMVAEDTNDVKQVITYVLVRDARDALLCFDRGVINRADAVLRGKSCVGFGGHVQAIMPTLFQGDAIGLFASAAQELVEELALPPELAAALRTGPEEILRIIGVLNDDSSPNGIRHFAFVFELRVDDVVAQGIKGREKSINRVRWLTLEAATRESVHQFEFWSQLCLKRFAPDLATATPGYTVRRARVLRHAKAICCVGQMGSGKTEAVSMLATTYGFSVVNSGEVVGDILGLPPIPTTPREVFQEAAAEFITRPDGPELLAQELARRVSLMSGRVLVDGVRQPETLDALKRLLGPSQVGVVYVHAPVDIAYEFYKAREDADATMVTFTARRSARVEIQVTQMLDTADAAIFNWIGRTEYQRQLQEFAIGYLLNGGHP